VTDEEVIDTVKSADLSEAQDTDEDEEESEDPKA
jgi:hypothetical protein